MKLRRAALGAAVLAASFAAPAAASDPVGVADQNVVWRVPVTANYTLANRIDASCTFHPDRMTADYGATTAYGVATTTGALSAGVRCELLWGDDYRGDQTWTSAGPAVYGEDRMGFVPNTGITLCVTAWASFRDHFLQTERTCARR